MIRERTIQSWTYSAGGSQIVDLPRDAVYHIIQIEGSGSLTNVQGASGTGCVMADDFPFSILRNIRLLRNGSDVVFQGSGGLLALEHYYLNERFPHARIYRVSGTALETLLLSTAALSLGSKGVTIPANSAGIGCRQVMFATTTAADTTVVVNFDFQMDLYLQMGPEDMYYGTLVDARRLATYQLALDYATVEAVVVPGTANTNTIACTGRVLSYDQDNLATSIDFGTFKRSQLSFANIPYGSSNYQVLLPRGNYFHGIITETLAQKSLSTVVLAHENGVMQSMINRINSNFQLRQDNWEDLQRKNQADGCVGSAFSGSRGQPNGAAYLYFPVTGDRCAELVPTHVMDQFDLQINTASITGPSSNTANPSITGPENGATTSSTNPTINFLLEEVIPGVSLGESYPTAAMAGSKRATSAKPYSK
jgi:hypothetical protein